MPGLCLDVAAFVQGERGERAAPLHHHDGEARDHAGQDQRFQLQRGIAAPRSTQRNHCLSLLFRVSSNGRVCAFPLQIKYKESWHTLRAQGYKLTMQDIPFQAAKSSTGIASDVSVTSTEASHFIDQSCRE